MKGSKVPVRSTSDAPGLSPTQILYFTNEIWYHLTKPKFLFHKNKHMKTASLKMEHLNPMVIFWLGVLTGALVVGLTFLYKSFDAKDGGASVFRSTSYSSPAYTTSYSPASYSSAPLPPTY